MSIEKFSSTIPFFLFYLYSIGYAYYWVFFKTFGIAIANYLTLSDLIFLAPNNIALLVVATVLTLLFIEITYNFLVVPYVVRPLVNDVRKNYKTLVKRFWKSKMSVKMRYLRIMKKGENYLYYLLSVNLLIMLFGLIGVLLTSFLSREIYFLLPAGTLVVGIHISNWDLGFRTVYLIAWSMLFFLCSFAVFGMIGEVDAKDKKLGKDLKKFEFSISNETYSSDSGKFLLIGETSDYLFLYDTVENHSLTFNKSNVSLIKTFPND